MIYPCQIVQMKTQRTEISNNPVIESILNQTNANEANPNIIEQIDNGNDYNRRKTILKRKREIFPEAFEVKKVVTRILLMSQLFHENKNNLKIKFIKQTNINYSINEFFSLDMFNPILQKIILMVMI